MQRTIITLMIGLVIGAVIGVGIGWLAPVGDVGADLSELASDYKADYAIMVGATYARDGDWDAAQARLGALAEPDLAGYLVALTEQSIAVGRSPEDIRNLARMSARFGNITPSMIPYLPTPVSGAQPTAESP